MSWEAKRLVIVDISLSSWQVLATDFEKALFRVEAAKHEAQLNVMTCALFALDPRSPVSHSPGVVGQGAVPG